MSHHRQILHLDLDTFFVSVERLLNPNLIGKPVIVGGNSERGVVAACSYEARKYGVHSAMPSKQAARLCPHAVFLRGSYSTYSQYSKMVTEIVREGVPLFQKSSVDEFYADLTGTDRYLGSLKLATELRKRIIKETGLPNSFGLSTSKVVSKIATGEAKPNNQIYVPAGTEKAFLAPLSIHKIPMVGEKTYQKLQSLGVEKIGTIQRMSPDVLQTILGQNGLFLWNKANGIDTSGIETAHERKSMSTERTFDDNISDPDNLQTVITAMAENLAMQLRSENFQTCCVTVKIRYSNFETVSLQEKLSFATSSDHLLVPKAVQLLHKRYRRGVRVRLVGVRYSQLQQGCFQAQLFDDTENQRNLYKAMDKLRNRFGDNSVMRAAGMEAKAIIRRGRSLYTEVPA